MGYAITVNLATFTVCKAEWANPSILASLMANSGYLYLTSLQLAWHCVQLFDAFLLFSILDEAWVPLCLVPIKFLSQKLSLGQLLAHFNKHKESLMPTKISVGVGDHPCFITFYNYDPYWL